MKHMESVYFSNSRKVLQSTLSPSIWNISHCTSLPSFLKNGHCALLGHSERELCSDQWAGLRGAGVGPGTRGSGNRVRVQALYFGCHSIPSSRRHQALSPACGKKSFRRLQAGKGGLGRFIDWEADTATGKGYVRSKSLARPTCCVSASCRLTGPRGTPVKGTALGILGSMSAKWE